MQTQLTRLSPKNMFCPQKLRFWDRKEKGTRIMMNKKKTKSCVSKTVEPQGSFDASPDRNPNSSISPMSLRSSQNVFFNTCFDKNHLKTVIAWFLDQYGQKATVDLVETLKQVGFHQATRAGVSLGLDDLQIPPQKSTLLSQAAVKLTNVTSALQRGNLTSVEKSQRLIDTWNQTSETLRQAAVQNFRTTNPVNPVYMMAFSGARGNISQVRQLVAMRGLMADPQGAILEFPIQSNFREGLTVTEYLLSCYGARKGLVDTALRTATSGYLTRRLVDAVQHVVIHITDCQTKKGIVIKDKNLEQRLVGRVVFQDLVLEQTKIIKKNTLISQHLAKQISSQYKQIIVRSPLTCQTEKSVCQLCYGLDLSQGKLVSLGEAVGIIAAQSIGEPGTQLTMRTFHTGGVGVFSDQAMKSFTAPFHGKVEFLQPLSGLFVRTPHGNIVYLLKHKPFDENKPLLRLTGFQMEPVPNVKNLGPLVSSQTSVYEIMQSDVPPGSFLWVKQGEVVKNGQLLLQASRLQTATQQMPESSHPVRAPLSGEVFFQSMAIRVIEEQKRSKQKNKHQKEEISPTFPTLTKLGNFWVFSTFVQKEEIFCHSFFVNGDFFSSETPIQQYNLHLFHNGQLKKVHSLWNSFQNDSINPNFEKLEQGQNSGQVVFGRNSFDFLFSKITYSGLFYFLEQYGKKNSTNFLGYTSNSKSTLLTWYPFLKNLSFQSSGYCSVLRFQSEVVGVKNAEFIETSKRAITQKQDHIKYRDVSYVWTPHQVFRLKINSNNTYLVSKLKKFASDKNFVVSQNSKNLSKTGIFQFESANKLNWHIKTCFEKSFVKNSSGSNFVLKNEVFTKGTCANKLVFDSKPSVELKFIKEGLSFSQKPLSIYSLTKVIQKKQGWFYIPETVLPNSISSQLSGTLVEPSKKFETVRFDHSYVSTSLIHNKNLLFLKSKTKTTRCFFSYSLEDLLNNTKEFLTTFSNIKLESDDISKIQTSWLFNQTKQVNFSQSVSKKSVFGKNFNRQIFKTFCFYKKEGVFNSKTLFFETKTKQRRSHVLFVQKNSHQIVSTTKFFKTNWLFSEKVSCLSNQTLDTQYVNSPLFTKQYKTRFDVKQIQKPCLKVIDFVQSGWVSLPSFLKIELKFNTTKSFSKTEQLKQNKKFLIQKRIFPTECNSLSSVLDKTNFAKYQTAVIPSLSLFVYQGVKLQNSNQFKFLTFTDGWVLPEWKITEAFLTSKKLGEFRGARQKHKQTAFSLLQKQNRATVTLIRDEYSTFPKLEQATKTKFLEKVPTPLVKIGTPIRWGQDIFNGFAVPLNGQIIKTTSTTITVRKGVPLLASIRGLVHISHKDLVEKNDLLITLRSRRLQTEDIVQGIPKIEQLFEARETQGGEIIPNNMHILLNNFFLRARKVRPIDQAVQLSLTYIQKFLVENILEAYSNQGVNIAEKHVEVVVRQMTARVRIIYGGDTGFLPGEFVQLRWIEKVNGTLRRAGHRPAQYEPVILGITKSVLQSESFLLAASFQQVSKVLVRSALAKKTDFLRGLHENILVGQSIPAGTGIISLIQSSEKTQESEESSL